MKSSSIILKAVVVFVAYTFIQMVVGMMIPMKTVLAPNSFQWLLLTNLVVTGALSFVAARTDWRGWKLGLAVAAIPVIISSVNLLEAAFFLKGSQMEWGRIFLHTVISSALIVPVWKLLFGRRADAPGEHFHPIDSKPFGEIAWKLAVCALTYVFLYYGFGMIIYPFVRDFYATQHLPSVGTIVTLQFFVRGPAFVLLCLLLARMIGLPRYAGAIAVGIVFTLLTGVAPLLMPNPFFPDSVRWVHFCEVTSENFVLGAFVTWLWTPSEGVRRMVAAHV